MSEPRASLNPAKQTEAYETETLGLSTSRPLESDTQELVAHVSHSIPMEVDVNGDATSGDHGEIYSMRSFADVVADRNTQVFRPTPAEASTSLEPRQTSQG